MSLSIYTYSNPYEISNEPYWDSIKNCAHFCVSQTMVNGLSEVYDELKNGQLTTVEELVKALYPGWFDTKTYIEQYTILTNTLDNVTPNIEQERWKKIKQSLRFNKSALLDSIRLMVEMGLLLKNLKIKKITEEQTYLIAAYNAILHGDKANKFSLRKHFSEKEIDSAVQTALVAKDQRRGKKIKSVGKVDCNTVVIHGVHQFTPTILSMIEEVSKYKRVVLLFNYQQQYSEIYQTWLDVYSCFDLNIKSQFNNEFKPTTLLQTSYEGNILADQIGKLTNGTLTEKSKDINNVSVIEFDNITEFSAYVAHIYEDAVEKYYADEQKKGSVLSYMREQFYSANSSVNDILKVYFPEQFGERHFLAYPIGHFFVAVTKMWNSENGGIKIEDMNDIAECLCSGALYEKKIGSLITTFNQTSYIKNNDDKENELYYILKLLGIKTERNVHDTTAPRQTREFTFDLGENTNGFGDLDYIRRRICGYRFALESLIENGTCYQDRFLQTKYFEIILANIVRRKLEGQIATEAIINEALDDVSERLSRYFRFLNESEITDIKSNAKNAIIHQALQGGKIKQFPKITDIDLDRMRKKEEFIYLHLENENQENVLFGKFYDMTVEEKKIFFPEKLKEASYSKEINIWCQWCAVREKCLESYKSLVEL